jgi:hypothetical protein
MFKLREERGTILIIVAVGMIAFLGFLTLVIDGGNLYLHRNRLARAADAAALAGAQELPEYPSDAEAKAQNYAQQNGVELDRITVSVEDSNTSVTVETAATVDYFFARVLGFTENDVSARAKAIVGTVGAMKGLVPLEFREEDVGYTEEIEIKVGGGHGSEGAYGGLDLDGSTGGGANDYEKRLAEGYDGKNYIGQIVYIEGGNMAGPTDSGLRERLGSHAACSCTFDNYTADCPRLVYTPVVRAVASDPSGKKREIVGFAAFFITSVRLETTGGPNKAFITGRFVKTVTEGEIDQLGIAEDFGLRAVKLVE